MEKELNHDDVIKFEFFHKSLQCSEGVSNACESTS